MKYSITPKPMFQAFKPGTCKTYKLKRLVVLGPFEAEAQCFLAYADALGLSLTVARTVNESNGCIILEQNKEPGANPEGYSVEIDTLSITICAATQQGLFYGIQTLRHLLGLGSVEALATTAIPCMTIKDTPRFKWRGFMLDESRHFFGKDYVKKLLDWMSLLKMNRFHWHLTDEPAWRLEIKSYPKLTAVGSTGSWSDPTLPHAFYTQDEVREIVAYAAERHIVIIPEIDMPGHATAANRSYPKYSGGGSERCPEFTFNPGKEDTYTYLEGILLEVMEIFPGDWIHLGADEVHFGNENWNHDPDVQALMKRERLEDLKQVEHYFIKRMAAFVNSHGKTVIGWDEIVGVDLPADSLAIMWWRHDLSDVLAQSYSQGLATILCPRLPCYFDFVQHDSHTWGRRWPKDGFSSFEELYAYPPDIHLPEQASDGVLGIQGNLWTERTQNAQRADFMIFPRLIALAEAAWTPQNEKDLQDFKHRLPRFFAVMNAEGTTYFNPFDPSSTPEVPGVNKNAGEDKLEEEIQADLPPSLKTEKTKVGDMP